MFLARCMLRRRLRQHCERSPLRSRRSRPRHRPKGTCSLNTDPSPESTSIVLPRSGFITQFRLPEGFGGVIVFPPLAEEVGDGSTDRAAERRPVEKDRTAASEAPGGTTRGPAVGRQPEGVRGNPLGVEDGGALAGHAGSLPERRDLLAAVEKVGGTRCLVAPVAGLSGATG